MRIDRSNPEGKVRQEGPPHPPPVQRVDVGEHVRLKAKRCRHQPIRRVYIPKEQGKTRPIGISAFEAALERIEAEQAMDRTGSVDPEEEVAPGPSGDLSREGERSPAAAALDARSPQ